ncbi:MAG: succinate dehydrogenase iron-sulfur subunit [Alphaproteobacteria bacterium]|uniref:Fumarate reductase iron-sulfur subunit n=1 Tax=Candidatus Nitrobium versatile TaxID=2884831 RepID=A0A953M1G8_9BACT|nr:succinate dehydrogenase iron-sulfur subunit [Candidatus Nitrobium versatile]
MENYLYRIKRFDPEKDAAPRWEEFCIAMSPTERILDGLIRIKDTLDGSLTFRRSCLHGICGSCAMKINGRNALACQTLVKDVPLLAPSSPACGHRGAAEKAAAAGSKGIIVVEPLPALPVIKDLVVDMDPFFGKNRQVLPYLINNEPAPERERLQSPEDQQKILQSITCIMCGCCTSSCPSYWADKEYLGPAALLKAYRFIGDTRDRAAEERLDIVAQIHGLWRCHSIFNCVEVCPKDIDVTAHIAKLKRLAVKKRWKRS